MLTKQKLHEEGQNIKSTFQVDRAREEIAAKHYRNSFFNLVDWICGLFETKGNNRYFSGQVLGLVAGFILRVDGERVFITTEDVGEIEGKFEAEDLGEISTVPGFKHILSNGVILIPATSTTKWLFYEAVAHEGLLEQCELLAHIEEVCTSSTERLSIKNKIYSVKAHTGRFPSLAKTDDFIAELRGESFSPIAREFPARNDNTETFPLGL